MSTKSLALQMQEALGPEWKVDEVGYRECPRYLYRIYKQATWWIFRYWMSVGIMEHCSQELQVLPLVASEVEERLASLGIKVIQVIE